MALPSQIFYTPWHGESTPSLGDLSQCCTNLLVNRYFLMSTRSHPNCNMWPLALVYQLALLTRVWLHRFYNCPLGSCTSERDHPPASPALDRTSPASSASLCRSPDQFFTPLTDPFQLPNLSWSGGPKTGYSTPVVLLPMLRRVTTCLHLARSSKGSLLCGSPYLQ